MHHRMEGQMLTQSQEEMAVIGIFALFWVGEWLLEFILDTGADKNPNVSIPCWVQVDQRRVYQWKCTKCSSYQAGVQD